MKKSFAEFTGNTALYLMAAGAVATVSAILVYVWHFGPGSNYKLSSTDTNAWANFGTYLGGVLGPFFGLLAFIGVLMTVVLQARQLDAAQKQAGLEEFQRSLSNAAANLDALLKRRTSKPLPGRVNEGSVTVRELIAGGGHSALVEAQDNLAQARKESIVMATSIALQEEGSELLIELDHLVWCLKAYEDEGGRHKVLELYQRRYLSIVIWLDALGLIDREGNVANYFEPQKRRHTLTDAQG